MSWEAMQWALHDSPTITAIEFAVINALADRAGPDGCGAFPSKAWLAARARTDEKVVQRTLVELKRRSVIAEGDQGLASYIRADRRPTVWDLPIPAAWYSSEQLAKINKVRSRDGRVPITAVNRPPLDAAPEKPKRADAGKKRALTTAPMDNLERGDLKTPREAPPGDSETPREGPRRDFKSSTGGLQVPHGGTTRPPNLKEEPAQEPLSRSDASEPHDGHGVTTGERDLGGIDPNDLASLVGEIISDDFDEATDRVAAAWTAARGSEGIPHFALANLARSTRDMLAENIAVDVLCAAAADMAPKGWTDLRKHLEHWSMPAQRAAESNKPCGPDTCNGHDHLPCDHGWVLLDNGRSARCPCSSPQSVARPLERTHATVTGVAA